MKGVWALFVVVCACAEATLNSINLGEMSVTARVGQLRHSGPATDDDRKAAANARVALEHLRPYFPTGLGYIPALDPFHRPRSMTVHITRSDFTCTIELSNIRVTGGQTFSLSDLEIRLNSSNWNFTMDFNRLAVHLDYKAKCKTDNAVTEFQSTHFNMTLNGVHSKCAVSAAVERVNREDNPDPEVLRADALHLKAKVRELLYDLDNERRVRRSVPASKLTRLIAKDLKNDVGRAVAEDILLHFNEVVAHYGYQQIMTLLLPESNL